VGKPRKRDIRMILLHPPIKGIVEKEIRQQGTDNPSHTIDNLARSSVPMVWVSPLAQERRNSSEWNVLWSPCRGRRGSPSRRVSGFSDDPRHRDSLWIDEYGTGSRLCYRQAEGRVLHQPSWIR